MTVLNEGLLANTKNTEKMKSSGVTFYKYG